VCHGDPNALRSAQTVHARRRSAGISALATDKTFGARGAPPNPNPSIGGIESGTGAGIETSFKGESHQYGP
jgi:hypothetical protein